MSKTIKFLENSEKFGYVEEKSDLELCFGRN
jgi:hypothetical protein